jgi:hypothetical protein
MEIYLSVVADSLNPVSNLFCIVKYVSVANFNFLRFKLNASCSVRRVALHEIRILLPACLIYGILNTYSRSESFSTSPLSGNPLIPSSYSGIRQIQT